MYCFVNRVCKICVGVYCSTVVYDSMFIGPSHMLRVVAMTCCTDKLCNINHSMLQLQAMLSGSGGVTVVSGVYWSTLYDSACLLAQCVC